MIARRVTVSGRVQGVFFRDSCRRQAERTGVSGWVRNTDDGRVEAHVEGEPEAVDALVTWCRTGSPQAQVDTVDVHETQPEGLPGFRIL